MRVLIAITSLCSVLTLPANLIAGTIKGTIQASRPASDESSPGGAYQSRRYKFLEQIDYDSLGDFVVSIDEVEHPATEASGRPKASVVQRDGSFFPHITPIVAGSEIEWPNRDDIYHNVFSMSDVKPFDLGMYKSSDDAKSLVFEKTGKIDVFCAIHSQMHCVVLVLPNPWFSKSDRKGRFEIPDVPPGKYRLKAWHERLPSKFIDIEVPAEGEIEIDIEMGFADLPKI
ncbi:hypothetical protein IEN85_20865 [Pelagicoccus sp. NFK12]|uniref:Rhamnogalacturonan lyase domain-containing protein n=1 Tax=Pelagicoccus enzymogenes TaxID=2773457 RepID=A0A927IJK5_9BACT|nr:carboxypeptidase regulatory-like domain-containing protein [Pelagicoccus enzymogenes]MBD5781964.1 hypothetical protein [Pelagicoccus enzymogenes]